MLRILFSRPVGVMLGQPERAYLLSALRPIDLADLESLCYASWPNPAESLPEILADSPEARQGLREAMDAAEAGPPTWSTTADPQLASATTLVFLKAVFRAHDGVTEDDLRTLASQLTHKQWARIYRVAWGADPAREILTRIDTLIGFPPEPSDGVPWAQAIADLVEQTGWTLDVIGQLSLPAINCLRNGGKPLDPWESGPEMPIHESGSTLNDPRQEARAKFFTEGTDDGR